VNAVGSFRPDMQELPGELFVRRPKVVVESVEAALEETGDLLIPMEQGLFSESLLYAELGDIVAGKKRAAKIGKKLRFLSRSGWLQWML
jgi:ornithine cyclodeaminase